MTYSARLPSGAPLGEMSQDVLLAALKLQMQGLVALFGNAPSENTPTYLAQQEAETDDDFDNMPV